MEKKNRTKVSQKIKTETIFQLSYGQTRKNQIGELQVEKTKRRPREPAPGRNPRLEKASLRD